MPFTDAFNKTMTYEGGYSDTKGDRGGETYKGITRKNFPDWDGWSIIDKHKPLNNNDIIHDAVLDLQVKDFYNKNFWTAYKLDQIDTMIAGLSEKLFDCIVNMGPSRPVKFLQSTINLLNKDQADIAVDGGIGPGTIKALQDCVKNNPAKRILTVFAIYQGSFYKDLMEKDPSQRKFVGWFDRVTF
jgi:lysozyme family protein